MKKMIAAAAAVVTGVALAGEALTSSNVVGYQNFSTGEYITPAGAAFLPVSGVNWVCLDKVFDNDVIGDDVVYLFDPEVWNLNSYQFSGFNQDGVAQGWAYAYTDTETWEPAAKVISSFELNKGDTVFFQPADAVSGLTVSGQVQDPSQSATWTLPAGEWIGDIMNPFPVDTTLAEIEKFAVNDDVVYVFNYKFWNLDSYQFLGLGQWQVTTTSDETWEQISYLLNDTTTVILPAGIGGTYQPADMNGRSWTITLK